jgi:hypothetical protein
MDIEPHAPRGSPLTISISELPAEHGEECVFCTAANAAEAAGNPARLVDPPVYRMLINLRGTSGSGKSTAVLGLLAQCPHKPIYGALGRLPEAYGLCARPVRGAAGNFRPFNPNLLTQKYHTISKLKDKFGDRAVSVSDRDATATIMRLLRTAEGTSAGAA